MENIEAHRELLKLPEWTFPVANVGQETYARKTGAEFSREMARSVRKALEAWKGRELQQSEPQQEGAGFGWVQSKKWENSGRNQRRWDKR